MAQIRSEDIKTSRHVVQAFTCKLKTKMEIRLLLYLHIANSFKFFITVYLCHSGCGIFSMEFQNQIFCEVENNDKSFIVTKYEKQSQCLNLCIISIRKIQ